MAEICQGVLDGSGMPVECAMSVVVPIFKGKGDIRNCCCYGAVKLLEHRMIVVERVLEKRLSMMVSVDEMQFGFMSVRGTIDAVFILSRMYEEYLAEGYKLCMCFVYLENAFDGVLRKVLEGAMRKIGIPEFWVRSVMRLYEGAKTKV